MQDFFSLLLSTLCHLSLALVAIYFPQQEIRQKQSKPYTLELLVAPENNIIKIQPPIKKQVKKTETKKQKPTRKLVTQKQKSPVKVLTHTEVTDKGAQDTQIMDARLLKQKQGNKPPEYSISDRLRKQTGRVVVMGYVNRFGEVSQVRILESTGTRTMNDNSIHAFAQYQFEENQPGWVKMPYEFLLEGESKVLSHRDRAQFQKIK